MAEDIIAALGRFRSFTVLSGSTSFLFRDRGGDPRAVAQELGVRYLLRGTVRRAGDRLRISAELMDGTAGTHLWAESYDGAFAEVFAFQDRITESVATVIEPQIQAAELARVRRERPGSVAAYDIYLQARARILAETPAENAAAYALLTEALALDPDNPRILAHTVWVIEHRTSMGWPPFGPDDVERCASYARRALERAAGDPAVMAPCGIALMQTVKDYDWGLAVLRAAADANPNDLLTAIMAGVGEYALRQPRHGARPFRAGPAPQPARPLRVHLLLRHRRRAHGPRHLCRGGRVGEPLAGAEPQLRPDALEPHRRQRTSRAHAGGAPLPGRAPPDSAGGHAGEDPGRAAGQESGAEGAHLRGAAPGWPGGGVKRFREFRWDLELLTLR